MTPLCELAVKYGCDKTPSIHHRYTPYYHELLQGRHVQMMLEIGIFEGASLRMWRDYFPNAEIVGVDKDPRYMVTENRIISINCNQSDTDSLLFHFAGIFFDLIVDDGSHAHADQISSLSGLYDRCLRPGGLYVIEDVQRPAELSAQIPVPHHIECFGPLPPDNDDCLIVIEKGSNALQR